MAQNAQYAAGTFRSGCCFRSGHAHIHGCSDRHGKKPEKGDRQGFLGYCNGISVFCCITDIFCRGASGKKFLESLQSQAALASGNVFLKTPVSLEAKRKDVSAKHDTRLNLFVACMFFLLMIIFLGILGTFWFRIRQREGEIALRRVTGATRGDIFRRILSESMLLLVIATIPAILLDVLLLYRNMSLMNGSRLSIQGVFWISGALTFLVMTLSILLGAWFPASRAMRIHPAEALKEE